MRSEPRLGGIATDIAVRGGAIRIETLGSGPPLLLLHGWTLDRRMWLPQVHVLAKRHRVIAIDRRGFGQSSAPPDLSQESADLLAITDTLGLDRFALLGMSQGARVALAFAVQHPQRLSALIVQGAPLSGVPGGDDDLPVNQMAVLAIAGELPTLRYLWRHHPLMQVNGLPANAIVDHIVADYAARDLAGPAHPLDISETDLAHIAAPALVITGANEPAWRHRVAGVIARALGAERLDIADAGHLANLDQPDAYNPALIGFLAEAGQLVPTKRIN